MKIRVTQKHIRRGVAGESQACPIALALHEATGHRFIVDSSELMDDVWSVRFRAPASVSRFVERFDQEDAVKPFTFNLTMRLAFEYPTHSAARVRKKYAK